MAVSSIEEVVSAYRDLEKLAGKFSTKFFASNPSIRYLAKLPFPYKNHGELDQGQANLDLAVDQESGRYHVLSHIYDCNAELKNVAALLAGLEYEPNQDRKSTIRMPGLVVVSERITKSVSEFNIAKSNLKELIGMLPKDTPRRALRDSIDSCLLHAYRKVILIDESVEQINFTWASKNTSVKKLTIEQLRNKIQDFYMGGDAEARSSQDEIGVSGERMLDIISDLEESEVVAIKRLVKPHIKINYKTEGGWRSVDSSTPILLTEKAVEKLSAVKPLSIPEITRKPRKSVYENEPLIETLNCYRYVKG